MRIKKHKSGFTLVEIAISILVIMVLVTGAMGYQYYSARDVTLSEIQATAARLSMLLLEGWKGAEGSADFDPVSAFSSEITITNSLFGPNIPEDKSGMSLTLLGCYEIELERAYYYVTLSWGDASSLEPKVLNITTAWRRDYSQGTLVGDEACVRYSTFFVDD
ncbi:MAG: prepilin-type N-terminal cleavage/methylation domain-containing protein [Phycisphaerae bacterium]|nr:prepilin-type N-terminal cleavage/methylation domain-containing protein [Phycisphaerae bacterium]